MAFAEDFGRLVSGNRHEKQKAGKASPDKEATEIFNRLWNRQEVTPESNLTDDEALKLIHAGGEPGRQLVEEEREYGRYEPRDPRVRSFLGLPEQEPPPMN